MEVETTGLIEAVKQGDIMEVRKHIDEVRCYDGFGRTALMYAAEQGNCACVKMLVDLEGGMQNKYGLTALMFAIQRNRYKVIPHLLEKEAKMKDNSGWTGLMYAVTRGQMECVKILLCEVTLQRNDGYTALMMAVEQGKEELVALLKPYEQGMSDHEGRTASWFATELKRKRSLLIKTDINLTVDAIENIIQCLKDELKESQEPIPSIPSSYTLYDELLKLQAQNNCLNKKIIDSELLISELTEQLITHKTCADNISFLQEQLTSLTDLMNNVLEHNTQLKAENDNLLLTINTKNEGLVCVICLYAPKSILLRPCNHCCVCHDCAQHIKNVCPLCRTPVQETLRIFL